METCFHKGQEPTTIVILLKNQVRKKININAMSEKDCYAIVSFLQTNGFHKGQKRDKKATMIMNLQFADICKRLLSSSFRAQWAEKWYCSAKLCQTHLPNSKPNPLALPTHSTPCGWPLKLCQY
jgi:hypothetical protein